MCLKGLDPNFHDEHGETPLTIAAGIENNRNVLIQLVGGGAHLDFRNAEGQVNYLTNKGLYNLMIKQLLKI